MNKVSLMDRRWRKRSKRGVSPIIATILLVAITVVLAAVLYILISGLTKGPGSTPLSVQFGQGTPGQSGAGNFYDTFQLSVSTGITTSQFGLKVVNTTGITYAPTSAALGANCAATKTYSTANCAAAGPGWYGVLTGPNGVILATFSGASASWSVGTVSVNNADTLTIVSPVAVAGSAATMSAYGVGGASVSGSGTL